MFRRATAIVPRFYGVDSTDILRRYQITLFPRQTTELLVARGSIRLTARVFRGFLWPRDEHLGPWDVSRAGRRSIYRRVTKHCNEFASVVLAFTMPKLRATRYVSGGARRWVWYARVTSSAASPPPSDFRILSQLYFWTDILPWEKSRAFCFATASGTLRKLSETLWVA